VSNKEIKVGDMVYFIPPLDEKSTPYGVVVRTLSNHHRVTVAFLDGIVITCPRGVLRLASTLHTGAAAWSALDTDVELESIS
jgi:hypothetical protein